MPTFCEIEEALANVRGDIVNARQLRDRSVQQIGQANASLGNIPTTYGSVISAIDAAAGTDPAYADLKLRKDKMVAEYVALKAEVQAAVDALDALP